MFKGKPTKVVLAGKAKEEFDELNRVVGEEISKGVTRSDHQTLLNSVKQKIELLKVNPQYGIHIPKNRVPKEYVREYGVNNKNLLMN